MSKAKEVLGGLGAALLMVLFLVGGLFVGVLFLLGATWASERLLPWFSWLTWICLAVVVLVLLPLAIPRSTRGFSSIALLIASYVFGVTLWMLGLLLTLATWGVVAVIIGLFFMGIGVVPIAMLATLVKGMWLPLADLVVLTVMTFGTRIGAMALVESAARASAEP